MSTLIFLSLPHAPVRLPAKPARKRRCVARRMGAEQESPTSLCCTSTITEENASNPCWTTSPQALSLGLPHTAGTVRRRGRTEGAGERVSSTPSAHTRSGERRGFGERSGGGEVENRKSTRWFSIPQTPRKPVLFCGFVHLHQHINVQRCT